MIETGGISSQVLIRYEKRMTTSVSSVNAALARNIELNWTSQPQDMIKIHLRNWRLSIEDLNYRFNETIFREGANHIFQARGQKNNDLEFLMNFIRPELRAYSARHAVLVEDFLRRRIQAELNKGLTPAEIRQNIVSILLTNNYAERIAKTEAHTALERGAWQAADSLGVRVTKEWISREDSLVRRPHAVAHGQIREINQDFSVGGERLLFPGDPRASARNRVHCRCTVNYRLG